MLTRQVEESCVEGNVDEAKKLQLRTLKVELLEKKGSLKELDEEILDYFYENDESDEVIDKDMKESSEYAQKVTSAILKAEDALEKWNVKPLERSAEESIRSATDSSVPTASGVKVKLPKLELRKFSGRVADWQEFWDGFSSAVHENPGLAKVDKLKYLKGLLEEPARSVLTGIATTDSSYDIAVDLLHKRFAKPSIVQRAHISELMNLPPVFNDRNVTWLRKLLDQIEAHYRGLEALKVDMATYSNFVVPLLMEKIPEQMRINMIRFSSRDHLEWSIKEFVQAFEKEIVVRESHVPLGKPNSTGSLFGRNTDQKKRNTDTGTANALMSASRKINKCVYCLNEQHSAEDCNKVTSVEERKGILRRYAKCFICLNAGHRAANCRQRNALCKICQGRHHASICSANTNQTAPFSTVQTAGEVLNPNAASWVGSASLAPSSSTKVALQTAMAVVNDKKERRARVLFDCGSQRSFITAKAVEDLGLVPSRRENLGIKVFGKNEVEYAMRDVFVISLSNLGGESVKIECFLVEEISSITNEHVEIIKKGYSHLHKIYFSDVSKDEDFLEIDILVGSDFIWGFQKGQSIRGGPNEPIAVKTTLGWVLSGPLKGHKPPGAECQINFVSNSMQEKHQLEECLHKLWDLDSIG